MPSDAGIARSPRGMPEEPLLQHPLEPPNSRGALPRELLRHPPAGHHSPGAQGVAPIHDFKRRLS